MKKFYPLFFLIVLFTLSAENVLAQGSPRPDYAMKFQFRNDNGSLRDTAMFSRFKFGVWSKSAEYPTYVKWKNQPFAVNRSPIHGVGLFTDLVSVFSQGQTIGYIFYKVGSSGSFDLDYMQTNLGSFVNNSAQPNTEIVSTPQGLLLKAKESISSNTEITASYQELLNLFPNDESAVRTIKYW